MSREEIQQQGPLAPAPADRRRFRAWRVDPLPVGDPTTSSPRPGASRPTPLSGVASRSHARGRSNNKVPSPPRQPTDAALGRGESIPCPWEIQQQGPLAPAPADRRRLRAWRVDPLPVGDPTTRSPRPRASRPTPLAGVASRSLARGRSNNKVPSPPRQPTDAACGRGESIPYPWEIQQQSPLALAPADRRRLRAWRVDPIPVGDPTTKSPSPRRQPGRGTG